MFQLLLALGLAVVETLLLYATLSLVYNTPPLESCLGQVHDPNLPWLVAVMLSRGPLPALIFCLFGLGATLLLLRLWALPWEYRAFSHAYFANLPVNEHGELILGERVRALPLENVRRIAKEYSGVMPLLVRRLEVGSQRLAEEGDATQVQAVMQAVSDIDRDALESRFTLVRYLVWLIPTLGFLGTVIGIGRAIAGFSGVMSGFADGEMDFQARMQPLLGEVARDFGVAFDNTMLSLLLTAVLVALSSVVQTREEGLLSSINDFCLRHFVSRIAVPDFGSKQMGDLFQQAFMALINHTAAKADGRSGDGFSIRDLAGRIDFQTEQIKETLTRLGPVMQGVEITRLREAAESLARSAELIRIGLGASPDSPKKGR